MAELTPSPDSCSVCGRTILAGEGTREYVTRDGERRWVCDLCRMRAEAAGWIPAELAAAPMPESNHEGRGRGRMRRLWERARESASAVSRGVARPEAHTDATDHAAPEQPVADHPGPAEAAPEEPLDRETDEAALLEPGPVEAHAPPTPRPRRERRLALAEEHPRRRRRSIPQSPNRRIKRAFESFNESEYPRTIAGLIRSLGPPRVAAVTTAQAPEEVRITVAWELSWYQWEVDLTGEGVRELAKGEELGQLSEDDQGWNGYATEDGELRFGTEGGEAGR